MKNIIVFMFILMANCQLAFAEEFNEENSFDNLTISDTQLILTPKEEVAVALSKAFQDKNVKPMIMKNGRVTFAYGMSIPSIICSPLMVTDIEFDEGEELNDVVFGDTARWQVTIAKAGTPTVTHLIIKPFDAGLHTTAVITTNKRAYHLEFRSQKRGHVNYVGFVYPNDVNRSIKAQLAEHKKEAEFKKAELPTGEQVEIANLFFDYKISGSKKIRPSQVYSNNHQTFIKMPVTLQEMPVLMVRFNDEDVLVNYRINEKTIIVDELFEEAVLIAGVGSNQEKVVIEKR